MKRESVTHEDRLPKRRGHPMCCGATRRSSRVVQETEGMREKHGIACIVVFVGRNGQGGVSRLGSSGLTGVNDFRGLWGGGDCTQSRRDWAG